VVLSVYLAGQAIQAAKGSWMIGPGARAPVYVAVDQPSAAPYRVLWLGQPDGEPFPSPGGLPDGTVAAGHASVRFALTSTAGASALDLGRPVSGPGYAYVRRVLAEMLTGDTRHGGALLRPLGIRYLIAAPGDIPAPAFRQLTRQLDMDVVLTQGLTVLSVAAAVPRASIIDGGEWRQAARSNDLGAIVSLPAPHATPLSGGGQRYSGALFQTTSLVLLAQQDSGGWRLDPRSGGPSVRPVRAFGWAVGFLPPSGPSGFDVRFDRQRAKTVQVLLLALLWVAALWLTRRPIRSG
jgi:hypothetical protein